MNRENTGRTASLSSFALVAWFGFCMVATGLGLGFPVFTVTLLAVILRAASRPLQVTWLVFFMLATAVISVPYDYVAHWGGEAPAPYWYWGFSILLPAAAAFGGLAFKREARVDRSGIKPAPWALKGFLAVTLLATVYGYAQGNGIGIILRQSTGLLFLFLFILLGRDLDPSASQLITAFRNVRCVLVAYGLVYLVRYIYLNIIFAQQLPEGTFLREPNSLLFFCGLFAALSVGESLFRKTSFYHIGHWVGTGILGLAAILSGSRSTVASMLLTITFLILLRYAAHPFRLGLVLAAAALILASLGVQEAARSVLNSSPFLQHVADRFVVSLDADSSFLQRSSQMLAIWDVFQARPLLGQGLGASLVWFDPASLSFVETAFVDTGIGYLLLKMGAIGALAFFWFLGLLFHKIWRVWKLTRHPLFLAILGTLVYYTGFMPFGPSFFQFLFCFWVATLIGYVLWTSDACWPPVRLRLSSTAVNPIP